MEFKNEDWDRPSPKTARFLSEIDEDGTYRAFKVFTGASDVSLFWGVPFPVPK